MIMHRILAHPRLIAMNIRVRGRLKSHHCISRLLVRHHLAIIFYCHGANYRRDHNPLFGILVPRVRSNDARMIRAVACDLRLCVIVHLVEESDKAFLIQLWRVVQVSFFWNDLVR